MAKATHNGHCQMCGRIQAVKANGQLAKHGYTTRFGFFEGTCPGSDRAPLETSRAYADEMLAWAEIQAAKEEAFAAQAPDSITSVTFVHEQGYGWNKKRETVTLTREEYELPENAKYQRNGYWWENRVRTMLHAASARACNLRRYLEEHANLIARVHGTSLMERGA